MTDRKQQQGFSLVEISVVLVVVATMLAGVLPAITESQKTNAISETAERMEAIEQAVLTFRSGNSRIPCPSNNTTAVTNTNFGRESATPGTCTGGTPAANYTGGGAAMGGVPVKALGLPDEYAFDGWGRRIDYHVTTALTAAGTFPTTTAGVLNIRDSSDTDRTITAAFALVSHGPNGHGGFTRGGTRYNFTTTNTRELENCDCDSAAAYTAFDLILYQYMATPNTNALQSFDDVVRYMSRSQLDLVAGSGGSGGLWMDAGSNNIRNTNTANVGVGIATPLAPLHTGFSAASGEGVRLSPSAAGVEGGQISLMDGTGAGGWEIDTHGAAGAETLRFFRDKAGENVVSSVLVLTVGGNVGIGTTNPGAKLTITNGADDPVNYGRALQIVNASGNRQQVAFIRNGFNVVSAGYNGATNVWGFGPGNAVDASFSPSMVAFDLLANKVGIGTTAPSHKLEVNGTIGLSGGAGPMCVFMTTCATGWQDRGLAGLILENSSPCPYGGGSPYNPTWTWCHPRLCCNQ